MTYVEYLPKWQYICNLWLSPNLQMKLRILLKQNTALLSSARPLVYRRDISIFLNYLISYHVFQIGILLNIGLR